MSSDIDPTESLPPYPRRAPKRRPRRVIKGTVPAWYLEEHPDAAAELGLPTHDSHGRLIVHHALPQRPLPNVMGKPLPGQRKGIPATAHRHGKGRSILRFAARNVGRSKHYAPKSEARTAA